MKLRAEIARLTAPGGPIQALEVIAGGDGDPQTIAQQTLARISEVGDPERLTAPPGTSAMERARDIFQSDKPYGFVWSARLCTEIARAIEQVEREARAAGFEAGEACAVDNALSILDEEGWIGQSKQRIRALATVPQEESDG